ncbi:MAG: type I DNA topoisomerase, partial [Planctomycetes bacterium]|nr:type I DNA topoisomerase [Planctomycetota bacterium]
MQLIYAACGLAFAERRANAKPQAANRRRPLVATRKKKHLVIVESPAKAKTINKYLGPGYEVVASLGHVRDLPRSRFGIDIEGGWIPTYRDLKDRKDVLASLKKHAAAADIVYLAPDPDREGEAIAWHLKEALKLKDERIRRVTFNEITKSAVQKAFAAARNIDMDLVAAQEARRFLDRIVGYKLSPLLSQTLAEALTAGRVQSVAVRLIVDREREIAAFKPEEFWRIAAILQTKEFSKTALTKAKPKKAAKPKPKDEDDDDGDEEAPKEAKQEEQLPEGAFSAELAEWDGKKFKAGNQQEVDPIVQALNGADYVVTKVEQKDRNEKPPAPFTTSTLQQQASLRLRFSARRTMSVAQKLYEGVQLGSEGQVALITYMRTDSTRISDEALKACREHIQSSYGDKYLPEKANVYAASKDAQGAHEAIRPTDVSYTPEKVAKYLPAEQLKLYTLIYQRFVACQMMPAIWAVTNVEITAAKGVFKAQGKTLKFDGYRKIYVQSSKQEDVILPAMKEADPLSLLNLNPTQHFTEPPPRYNEASLVKTLEKEGIGRPSTYASIIGKIQDRGYVELKERRFYATPIGMKVTDLLVLHFPKVMDLNFTRHMEEELDHIEDKRYERNHVLQEFYDPFAESLKKAETEMLANAEKCPLCGKPMQERFSKFGKFFGCSGYPECNYIKKKGVDPNAEVQQGPPLDPEGKPIKCPNCGKDMVRRAGKMGAFLGCSGYPDCKTTMKFDDEGKPVVTSQTTEHVCEKCGAPMVKRQGKRGPFLGCSAYPKCKNIVELDAEGNPVKPIDTGVKCEKCGSPMLVKRSFRGPFLGCSGYPSCRSTKPVPEELKEKLKVIDAAAPPKKKVEAVDAPADVKCPECDGPMKLRPGRWGKYFYGCAKYPKCKGTMKAPADAAP